MKKFPTVSLLLAIASLFVQPLVQAQTPADPEKSSALTANTTNPPPQQTYTRPTQKTKLRNYFFDAFGPYPIVGAALAAGINQAEGAPPEWRQGAEAYGKRFGSNFAIAATATTTRYVFAEALREDTLYYRCECNGVFPRFSHAVISTFTSRRGDDGHRVFSFPAVVAPYAGTMTAVYGWYPGRYNAKDAFRMGNYSLLWYAGGNVALEFLFGGPHSLLSRLHIKNGHEAQDPASHP
jgi:hypothetical protein